MERLHIRVPMPDALLRFADDLDDPGADLIIAALIINARLRGPGLRDLLGSLSASVREELDMRRKVTAERRSTRRSVQIVVGVSVGLALALALLDHAFLAPYDGVFGQVVLAAVVGIYAAGISGCGGWRGSRPRSGCSTAVRPEWPGRAGRRRDRRRAALAAGAGHDTGAPRGGGRRPRAVPARLALIPGRPSLARQLAAFDAAHRPPPCPAAACWTAARARSAAGSGPGWRGSAPSRAGSSGRCGPTWRWSAGRSRATWPRKVLLAVFGLLFGPLLLRVLTVGGLHLAFVVPVWAGLLLGAGLLLAARPGAQAEGGQAAAGLPARDRRVPRPGLDEPGRGPRRARGADGGQRDRHRLGVLADQGRAGQRPDHRADAVAGARACSARRCGIDELRDLAAALSLVADDGAKVRESLAARAASLRRRELADMQGQAGERSQSMLVAQMLLAGAFLIFLIYPAVRVMLGV